MFLPTSELGVHIESVPFFPQERFQCGPAALATVLNYHGAEVTPDALEAELYVPEQQGSHRIALVAAARKRGLFPYQLTPTIESIIAELNAQRPVIVLQNLGLSWYPKWHYAVVVGYDAEQHLVILRSGTERVRRTAVKTFNRTWQRSGGWALVMLSEDTKLAARTTASEFLYQAAQLEVLGHYERAASRYQTAINYWPEEPGSWIGLSNVRYQQGKLKDAAQYLESLLALYPENLTALNNLAQISLELGHRDRATSLISRAADLCKVESAICTMVHSTCQEISPQRCP